MASQLHLTPTQGLIRLGHIQSAQGLNGQVRIYSETENAADICIYGPLWDATGKQQIKLNFIRMHKNSVICTIDGINDRNEAEALVGVLLCIEREKLPEAEEEEFYHVDLIGLEVRNDKDEILGNVRNVQNFGSQDLLDIYWNEARRTAFIPFTKAYVPMVDVKGGFIVVNRPKDLLKPVKSGSRRRRPPSRLLQK